MASIELSFHPWEILGDSCRGVLGETKMWAAVRENGDFCTCSSTNWETVEDRWVHAARGFASTELSFHSCNVLRDCHMGLPRANKKSRPGYVKMAIFCNCGSNNLETVVDRRDMLRGVLQAWRCFSVHAKFSAIGQTAFPGKRKTRLKWQNAMLYKIWT